MTCPSVCPLDQGSTIAALTAASSASMPNAKDASSLSAASRIHDARSLGFLAAIMVWKRSRRLRAATIVGEAVSIATLMRRASADLQSRSEVSSRAMVRAGGTVVIGPGRSAPALVARRLPHPLFVRELGIFFEAHWNDIEKTFQSSPGSVSRPILDDAGPRHVRITPHSDLPRIRLTTLSRFAYCLIADVSRFFPSIYSHTIPWALNGKAAAKLDPDWKSTAVWGNRLDFSVRQAQSRQTIGIPVGPDGSKIVAEIIMSSVDREFVRLSGSQVATYVRHVDDYWIGGHTIDECERHLRNLRSTLKEHSLDINELKTKIISTKFVFGESWPSEIERAISNSFHASGAVDFADPP